MMWDTNRTSKTLVESLPIEACLAPREKFLFNLKILDASVRVILCHYTLNLSIGLNMPES